MSDYYKKEELAAGAIRAVEWLEEERQKAERDRDVWKTKAEDEVRKSDRIFDALLEREERLKKARKAWDKRGVARGEVVLSEHDGSAQEMRDALREPPE